MPAEAQQDGVRLSRLVANQPRHSLRIKQWGGDMRVIDSSSDSGIASTPHAANSSPHRHAVAQELDGQPARMLGQAFFCSGRVSKGVTRGIRREPHVQSWLPRELAQAVDSGERRLFRVTDSVPPAGPFGLLTGPEAAHRMGGVKEIERRLEPDRELGGELGLWWSALEDVRRQTKLAVEGLTPDALAARPPGEGNSIGQLLRHIAGVELDWTLTDLCRGEAMPAGTPAMLRDGGPMDDPGARPLEDFLAVLDFARATLRARLMTLRGADPAETREYRDEHKHAVYTVRWILYHLVDHEAQHKGQILAVRRALTGRADETS